MVLQQQMVKDQLVWFRNPFSDENVQNNANKPFYLAIVLKVNGPTLSIRLAPQELASCEIQDFLQPSFDVDLDQTMEYSKIAEQGIADMVEIDELNHATLLHNLYSRYQNNEIYTYVGPIILAMNPFKRMPHLYTEDMLRTYHGIIKSKQPLEDRRALPPHIYAITAMAYKQMMERRIKQAIVISGESGSGKTESAKIAMNFLTSLSSKIHASDSKPMLSGVQSIESKILDTNPVLEAFGNAKTVKNDNSSRFGKYVLLYFNQSKGEILGARVKNYLLEKSRVVNPNKGERNYHVFYHILRGASLDLLAELGLLDPQTGRRLDMKDFNYLRNGGDVDQSKVNDIELYRGLAEQFNNLGFTPTEQKAIYKITAACLHLGEIYFDASTYNEKGIPCSVINMDRMDMIAKLLGIQKTEDLVTEIVNRPAIAGTGRTPLKHQECNDARDALAKSLYDNLFNWLVERMNLTILPENEFDESFKSQTKTIGLLDIFGFENFPENTFDQLCINYVNEKLHKLYISAIFDAEKYELRHEGLGDRVNQLKYPDLTSLDVIKLLDERLVAKVVGSKNGIFNQINDASTQNPRPSSDTLMKRIDDMHKSTLPNPVYMKSDNPKERTVEKFKIRHSAKEVTYSVKTFIERNVDSISASLDQLIVQKSDKTVANIYAGVVKQSQEEKKSQGQQSFGAKKTIWSKFSAQMQDLMNELAEPLLDFNKQDVQNAGKGQDKSVMNASFGSVSSEASKSEDQQYASQTSASNAQQQLNKKQQYLNIPPKSSSAQDVEMCQLHFIRCIKPNDEREPDTFIHAMCLQQITYMGVLESVDLKQKNYPYRKSFEEFYAKYEILSPIYGTCRYEQMLQSPTIKAQYDFKQLSTAIIQDTMRGFGQDFYAIGKTKILLRTELVALLDKAKSKAREKRDEAAKQIKRSFAMFLGFVNAKHNKSKLQTLQKQMKIKRQALIDERAKIFYEKALVSITKYKTEKRKDYESKAALVLTDIYKKYMFRRQLARSIKDRQKVVQTISNYTIIWRLRKFWICHVMTKNIWEKAFAIGRQRAQERAVKRVQRIFRGFVVRDERMSLVINALKAKENLKLHVAAKRVQKHLRGRIVRKRMHYLHMAAQKLQGFIKMKWTREFYLKLKSDVIRIQRGIRRFLVRRDIVKNRLVDYLTHEVNVLNNVRQIEYYQLFNAAFNGGGSAEGPSDMVKPHTPYSVKKIQLFTRVVDLHVISDISEVYSQPWSIQWTKLCKDNMQMEAPIMQLNCGATHSMAINQKGRLYCWGWNDNGQCAKNIYEHSEVMVQGNLKSCQISNQDLQISSDTRIKQILGVQDRCLVLTENNELIVWGSNDKGQLGLGTYDDQSSPRKVEFFSRQNIRISFIAAGGDLNLATSESGEAFAWPFNRGTMTQSYPVKMPFSEKVKINRVACGYNFGFFISTQGLVYSMGSDNSEGQLGLGHFYPRDVPELIKTLKDVGERIDQLECGLKHVIARSTLGKIYTWGWGAKGQLGHGSFDSELTPRLLTIEKNKHKEKVIQVAAGFSHCMVMLDQTRDLMWFGQCGQLVQPQNRPVSVKLSDSLPELFPENNLPSLSLVSQQLPEFAVVKVNSSWSKTLCATTLLIADLRQVNNLPGQSWNKIQSCLLQLATKWDPIEVMPPYIETISGMFNATMMKIPPQPQTGVKASLPPSAKNQSNKDKNQKVKTITNTTVRGMPVNFGSNIAQKSPRR